VVVAILCLSQGHGGLELYALREHKELQARDLKCISIVARDSMLARQLDQHSLDSITLDIFNRRVPLLAAKKLARILKQNQVDILHMHWNKDLNLAVLAKVFAARNIKLVYSRHMDIARSKRDILHRWFYQRIDLLLANSKLVSKNCQKLLPMNKNKIRLLHIGVAAPEKETPDCQRFFSDAFPRRRLNVACFGRIEPYKGQHVLVEAIAALVAEGLDVSATIIGHIMDPEYANNLQTQIQTSNLSSHIQFIGFVEEPQNLMRCFEVIVLTTFQETFGLVLAEAMRARVAVIGTNAGGVPDIIEHEQSGLLSEPGSAESLARAIKQLYDDPAKLDRLASQGKARADRLFSEDTHFTELKAILTELAD
jgi:glycosyltransferase involved in cell wall biosynthesis